MCLFVFLQCNINVDIMDGINMKTKPFRFYSDRSEVERGIRLPDGRIVPVSLNGEMVICFDQCLDLDKAIAYPVGVKVEGLLTLNDWVKNGATEVTCYDECDFYHEDRDWFPEELSDEDIQMVIGFFEEHGYHVSEKAIRHCFDAWSEGFKSGYRDEANGYHLFTPAGWINPLCFRLSTLDDRLDWQKTYPGFG